jgi:hypothetical protein
MEEEEIKKVKSLLRSVLIGVKEGVLATRLQSEFTVQTFIIVVLTDFSHSF